jgi:hypothetical protein
MSLHKLTAGSGYDYLTRQVAALDATDKGRIGLASYYTERGESPGVWVGCGLEGIDSLGAGDPVTAEQMRTLFGRGMHPLAEARLQQLDGPDVSLRDLENVMRLGTPFKNFDQATPFQVDVAKRIADLNATNGGRPMPRLRHRTGLGFGPRWPGSSSGPSTAGIRSMPGSWPGRSPKTHAPGPARSPVMT